MAKIRVLQVIGKMNRAGAETLIMNIYRNIDRDKVQFDFVVHGNEKCDYDDEIEKMGGIIYHAPTYKIYNYLEYKKWWKNFFKEHKEYVIMHGHIRSSAPIYLKEAKKHRLYTIVHSHSADRRDFRGFLFHMLTYNIRKYADFFYGCSAEALKNAFGKKVLESSNSQVLKNGIDVKKYIFNQKKREDLRKKMGIDDYFVIGHIGRFTYAKNHRFLIDVFEQILKKNKKSVLILVGRGELEGEIKKYIETKKLSNNIKFLGVREDVNDLLMSFDAFVFPSFFEGLSVVGIEAQATGIKCFVSEAFTDEGILSNNVYKLSLSNTPEEWANCILKEATNYERKDFSKIVNQKGFNIVETARQIEKFYLSKYDESE